MGNEDMSEARYRAAVERTRKRRMRWFEDARFGMFVHWGLYSQLGRHEWAMNRERIPAAEYEPLADTWRPKPGAPRAWARLARQAGMKYMVLTTKHHEGFLLWDSAMSDYNAVRRGPGRDLVREYVEAARAEGLKVGFYYSLMDWHHPDGHRCSRDAGARQRFLAYTQGCLRELMSNYGRIDILWYDIAWPLADARGWDSVRMNSLVRRLQPGILINDRAGLPEDFGTPEEHIKAADNGRGWEACMTFNGAWGWVPTPPEDWLPTRKVLEMLRTCCAGQGNLLLNVGPKADGSLPSEAVARLRAVGRWLRVYGDVVYGPQDRVENMEWTPTGTWTRRGRTLYYWCSRWPGRRLALGGLSARLRSVRLLPRGRPLPFTQTEDRLVIDGLPDICPDAITGTAVIEMRFDDVPILVVGAGCESQRKGPVPDPAWTSPYLRDWRLSRVHALPDVARAKPVRLTDRRQGWRVVQAGNELPGIVPQGKLTQARSGIVYLGACVTAPVSGVWTLCLGRDGGVRVWVDGVERLTQADRLPTVSADIERIPLALSRGAHEIMVAFDTRGGTWGIAARFLIERDARRHMKHPVFPREAPDK